MRRVLLIIAPLPIVAFSFALASWARYEPHEGATRNLVRASSSEGGPRSAAASVAAMDAVTLSNSEATSHDVNVACERTGDRLANRLGKNCSVIVREPLVIAGNFSASRLDAVYRRTIQPAVEAMTNKYFDRQPDEPVQVLLFSNESSYRDFARRQFGQSNVSVYGYYKPSSRTLVINLSSGAGTLVHELTHALVDFDYPSVPLWFNEGLASLHEQCRFVESDNGSSIQGLLNWRLPILLSAIRENRLQPLKKLTTTDHFLGDEEAINYAQARYLCLFLQQRGLLAKYYKLLRTNQLSDPRGTETLLSLFPDYSWADLDAEFRQWALALKQS